MAILELPDVLVRARAGDATARAAFVRAHADEVYRVVARILVGRREAWDDAAQDALIKVLDALPRFEPDGPASVRTWIVTIAARTAIDHLRRGRRYAARVDALEVEAASDDPEAAVARRELGQRVAAAMALLPDDQRVALVLRAYHDQDYAEIAAATASSVANVKSRIHRARAALAKALGLGGTS